MTLIPKSQLSLMRKRRELNGLIESGQFDKIVDLESDLFNELDVAVNDPERSPKDLLNELGHVIKLYRELSDICCIYSKDYHQP